MKTYRVKYQIVAVFAAILLTGLMFGGGSYYLKNKALTKDLRNEKGRSELLLSEKLDLSKRIEMFKDELNGLKGRNKELDLVLSRYTDQLKEKESEISRLRKDNAGLHQFKTKNQELEKMKQDLYAQLTNLNNQIATLKAANSEYQSKLALANQNQQKLQKDNNMLIEIAANNYLTEAVKGKKDKLTIKAASTDKLMVSFDLPSSITNKLRFDLALPTGEKIKSTGNTAMQINLADIESELLASNMDLPAKEVSKRVELSYKPEKKLKKGIYTFGLYNGDTYLGSTQIRLK